MINYIYFQIVVSVSGYVLSYLIYLLHGTEFVGEYSKQMALFMLIYSFSNFGIPNLLLYRSIGTPLPARDSRALTAILFGGALLGAGVGIFLPGEAFSFLMIFMMLALYTFSAWVQNVTIRNKRYVINFLLRLVFYAAPILWLLLGLGVERASAILPISVLSAGLIALAIASGYLVTPHRNPAAAPIQPILNRENIRYSITGNLGDIINMIAYRADLIVVGYFAPPTELGYYAIAKLICESYYLLPASIQGFFIPAFSKIRRGDAELIDGTRMLWSLNFYAFVAFVPVAFIVLFIGYQAIFLEVGKIVMFMLMSVYSQSVIKFLSAAFLGQGKPAFLVKISLLQAVSLLTVQTLAIYKLGLIYFMVVSALSSLGILFYFESVLARSFLAESRQWAFMSTPTNIVRHANLPNLIFTLRKALRFK